MLTNTRSMTIGTLAKACDVSTPTIRYYEQIGLLPKAERNRSDQRRYGDDTLEKLTFIRRCRAFGFSTEQVRTLLAVHSGEGTDCHASRDIALERIGDVRTKISDLKALEKALVGLITSCEASCGTQNGKTCGAFIEMRLPA